MSKYDKEIIGLDGTKTTVDVYRVIAAFGVTDPALQHAVKKVLCSGVRTRHKDYTTDINEAIVSLQKAVEFHEQRVAHVQDIMEKYSSKSDEITKSILYPDKEARFQMNDGSYFTFGKIRI